MVARTSAALIALTLAVCSAEVNRQGGSRPDAAVIANNPRSPDDGNGDPCGHTETVSIDGRLVTYIVPCRPYDRMRDLADPAP